MKEITKKQLRLPGGTVTYRRTGTGPALVFLHGLGGSSRSWIRQLETLSKDFTVIAWDAPGYGGSERRTPDAESYAQAAAEFIEALDLSRVTLIGHSMGGIVAGRLAVERPDLLSMLVLSSTFAGEGASPGDPLPEGFRRRIDELNTLDRKAFGRARAQSMTASHTDAEIKHTVADIAGDVNAEGYIDACKMLHCADNRAQLVKIQMPVLILEAAEDTIVTKEKGDVLADLIAHAQRHIQPGVGHAPYLENPDQYNQALVNFISHFRED